MDQLKLSEYVEIPEVYISFDVKLPRLHLSERIVRKKLEKGGWKVWRGGMIDVVRYKELYPNVKRKYDELCFLLEKYYPGKLEYLQYLCAVHHGLPDFICYKSDYRYKFKFIECKLGYEPLLLGQKKCISKLKKEGFEVEIYKLAPPQTKTIRSRINMHGYREVLERQEKLKII